jgi:hypothetical protein
MKKIIYVLGILILTVSCNEDSLTNLNEDEKNPSVVPAYTLFTNAEKSTSDQMVNTNVNNNIFRLVNQQFTETTYLDESNYDWTTRSISDNHWDALYAGPLADLNQAKINLTNDLILANDPDFTNKTIVKKNQLILIDILTVYNYQILVDTFGDVPYTEAIKGSGNYLPKYDKAVDIYKDLIVRLNNDIATIDLNKAAFGKAEVLYADNLNLWVKFANSIKLKLGVNLKASGLEGAIADAAIKSGALGGIASNADNAKVSYMADLPNTNPLYVDMVFSGRHDFVPTKPIVDALVAKEDPRIPMYFDDNYVQKDADGNVVLPQTIFYKGGTVGKSNGYSRGRTTHVSDKIQEATFAGTLLDYAEVEFLLAEAVQRGVSIGGTAEDHYKAAITASMKDWGVASSDIDTYLLRTDVNYTNAASGATWQEKIGNQAWYALYNRGFEGWTSERRLGFPKLVAPATAVPQAAGQVPSRMSYPIREQTLNPTNYNAAATAIGGDKLTTKLFWDKTTN